MNISVRDLSFSYPDCPPVFEHLSFDIAPGCILSILGPNGAGKSTLLACLARLQLPSAGDVLFDGRSYRQMSQAEVARTVGFVPQDTTITFGYSVLDYVVTGCAPRMSALQRPRTAEYEIAWHAIETMQLQHLAMQSCLQLSGGERQQVMIARVIAQRPAAILLDEPTAHLDVGNQIKVLQTMQQLGRSGYAVVLTTHNPDQALLLDDQVALLDRRGRLTLGSGRAILTESVLSELYGAKLRVLDSDQLGRRVCVADTLG